MVPVVLTVGSLEPSGAGGVAADLRAFAALRVHGAAVIASVGREPLPAATIERQLREVLDGAEVAAVKTGALRTRAAVEAVAAALTGRAQPVVVRPGLAGSAGEDPDPEAVEACRTCLLPLATVAAADLAEAALLTGTPRAATLGDMRRQGEALVALGCAHAVVGGGHGRTHRCADVLVSCDAAPGEIGAARLDRGGLRGVSDTFAAAIAANIARGDAPIPAVQYAKLFVTGAIEAAPAYDTGRGPRAVNAFHRLWTAPRTDG